MAITLKQLFTNTAKQYAENIAITHYKDVLSYQSISYNDLNQAAQKLSNFFKHPHNNGNNSHRRKCYGLCEDNPKKKVTNNANLICAIKTKIDEDIIRNDCSESFIADNKATSLLKDNEFKNDMFKGSDSETYPMEIKSSYNAAQNDMNYDTIHTNENHFSCKRNVVCVIGYYSPATVACMLGIMDSFAFMYLSADYTASEITLLIEKVSPEFVIFHKSVDNIPESFHEMLEENTISILNEIFCIIHRKNVKSNNLKSVASGDISYVITTSGSTGIPKVVYVPNKCILPNISDFVNLFCVNETDVLFCASPLTFDPSIVDLFMAFSTGAQVVLVPSNILRKPNYLLKVLCERKVSILQATPTLLFSMNGCNLDKSLLNDSTNLRIVALGGEQFPAVQTLKHLCADTCKVRFFNLYGITEVSCWASVGEIIIRKDMCIEECTEKKYRDNRKLETQDASLVHDKDKGPQSENLINVSIGFPLSDTVIKIFDAVGRELGEGKEGELFIGGTDRVCYINEVNGIDSKKYFSESNDRVPSDNSSIILNDMVLRATGDIGVIEDGKIYCIGRKDSVIKRNGQKVSLNEISQKCESLSYVLSSFSIVIEKYIVLFILPVVKISENKIREDLKHILATWKIPDDVIIVDEIPYNRHGKLDNVKLKEMWDNYKIKFKNDSKKYELKEFVSHCWYEYTGRPPTSSSNFINNGGTSFSAVRFSQDIEDYLEYQVPGFLESILAKNFEDIIQELISEIRLKEPGRVKMKDSNPRKKLKHSQEDSIVHDKEQKSLKMIDNAMIFQKSEEDIILETVIVSRRGTCGIKPTLNKEIPKKLAIHWTLNLGKCIDSSPIIIEYPCGKILTFVGSHSHDLACVDVKTGGEVWRTKLSDRVESSPNISKDGTLCYVGCYGGGFYCIDISTGGIVWKYFTNGDIKSSPCIDTKTGDIIFGSHDKYLHCVSTKGDLKWKTKISEGSIFSSPCIDGNSVFTATLDGTVACLNKNTGKIIWRDSVSKPVFSSIALYERKMVFGSVSGEIFAYRASGELFWKQKVTGPIFSSPYVYNISHNSDIICIGTHCKKVLFLNGNGEIIAKYLTNSPVYSTPFLIPINDKILLCIFCETSGHLSVLKLAINDNDIDLSLLVEDDIPGEIFASPVLHREYLVIGCRDDNVYCYKLE